jgi:O-antigen/teichoic acid export membrane protein
MSAPGAAARRLIANSRWNFAAFVVALLANLVSLPLAITAIGLDAFGSAGLVLAVFAPFTLVGTVLGQGLVRGLSVRAAAQASAAPVGRQPAAPADEGARVLWTTLALGLLGCAFVVALAALGGNALLHHLSGGAPRAGSWHAALWLGCAGWALQQGGLILQSALAALQAYRSLGIANALGSVTSALAVVACSRGLGNELGFLAGSTLGFAALLGLALVALWVEDRALLRPSRPATAAARPLLAFARWQGLSHLAGGAANQFDRYVLGAVAPLSVLGQYNVAMRLQEVVHMGLLKLTEVLFPHFSITAAQDLQQRARFYLRAGWFVNLVNVAALGALIPMAASLITLWVGREAATGGTTMLHTLATAGVIGSGINIFSFFALATDQAQKLAWINLAHALLLMLLTVPLILWLGPIAAGLAYVAGNLLRLGAASVVTLRAFAGALTAPQLLGTTLLPLAGGLAAAWLLHAAGFAQVQTWPGLLLAYAGCAALIGLAALAVSAASASGRALLSGLHHATGRR